MIMNSWSRRYSLIVCDNIKVNENIILTRNAAI